MEKVFFFDYFRYFSTYSIQFGSVIVVVSWVGKFLDVIENVCKVKILFSWLFGSWFAFVVMMLTKWSILSTHSNFTQSDNLPNPVSLSTYFSQCEAKLQYRTMEPTPAKVLLRQLKIDICLRFLNQPIRDRQCSILSTKTQYSITKDFWR